jgi:hypothetical protein
MNEVMKYPRMVLDLKFYQHHCKGILKHYGRISRSVVQCTTNNLRCIVVYNTAVLFAILLGTTIVHTLYIHSSL